jgi:hypothetical protein
MKKIFSYLALFLVLISCNEPEGFKEAEDPLDAGREFIRAVLNGDYEKAALYIDENEEDKELFDRYQQYMKKQPQKERLQLKSSSIIINKIEKLGDTASIINFSNSHTMKPMELKIIQSNKKWRVDFSFTFSGNLPAE